MAETDASELCESRVLTNSPLACSTRTQWVSEAWFVIRRTVRGILLLDDDELGQNGQPAELVLGGSHGTVASARSPSLGRPFAGGSAIFVSDRPRAQGHPSSSSSFGKFQNFGTELFRDQLAYWITDHESSFNRSWRSNSLLTCVRGVPNRSEKKKCKKFSDESVNDKESIIATRL